MTAQKTDPRKRLVSAAEALDALIVNVFGDGPEAERLGAKIGHQTVRAIPGNPEHDYCLWCATGTPGTADTPDRRA